MLTMALALTLLDAALACEPPELEVYDSQPRDGDTASTAAVVRVYFGGDNSDLSEEDSGLSVTTNGEAVSGSWKQVDRYVGDYTFQSVMTFTPEVPFADGAQVDVAVQIDHIDWSMTFTATEREPTQVTEAPIIERFRVRHDDNKWGGMCSIGEEERYAVLQLTAAAADPNGALALYKVDSDWSGEPSGEPFLISPGVQQGTQELTFWYANDDFTTRASEDCMVLVQLDEAGNASEASEVDCPRRVRVMCAAASAEASWVLIALGVGLAHRRRRDQK